MSSLASGWPCVKSVKPYGIQVECWFPLGGAMSDGALLKDPTIMQIAEAHGKTPAQVILPLAHSRGFLCHSGSIESGLHQGKYPDFRF